MENLVNSLEPRVLECLSHHYLKTKADAKGDHIQLSGLSGGKPLQLTTGQPKPKISVQFSLEEILAIRSGASFSGRYPRFLHAPHS